MYKIKFTRTHLFQIALAIICALLVMATSLVVSTGICFRYLKSGVQLFAISYNIRLIEYDAHYSGWTDHLTEEYDKYIQMREELKDSDDKIESFTAKHNMLANLSIFGAIWAVKALILFGICILAKFELRIAVLLFKTRKAKKI